MIQPHSFIKINVLNNIILNSGFKIADNGILEINSMTPVHLKDENITDSGHLVISAPQTILEKGFSIGKGACLQINVGNK